MYENLIAFQKAYDLVLYCVPLLNKFPKSQRFTLAQEIEKGLLRIVRFLMLGVSEKGEMRMRAWKAASRELDAVRVLLRLAKDLRFVSIRQYGIAAEKMNELGKCIGGLLASSAHRSQTGATGTFFARGGGGSIPYRSGGGWRRTRPPVLLRGGNWNNGSNAGAFTVNLNWDTGNTNNNVGFRCARHYLCETAISLA